MKYLGIDIGGSSIKYGVIDDNLVITNKGKAERPLSKTTADLLAAIESIRQSIPEEVSGIAVSMPGLIDNKKGLLFGSSVMKDKNIPFAKMISEYCHLPATIINDGKAAALAELGYGSLKGVQNGMIFVLGTGIGGGLIINGQLYMGSHFSAGEVSFIHSDIHDPSNQKTEFCETNGIHGVSQAIYETSGLENVEGIEAFKLIREGNKQVEEGIRLFAKRLAFHLYNIQCLIDAEVFAIGGGISQEETLITYINEEYDRYLNTLTVKFARPKIVSAKYLADANLLGALYNFECNQ